MERPPGIINYIAVSIGRLSRGFFQISMKLGKTREKLHRIECTGETDIVLYRGFSVCGTSQINCAMDRLLQYFMMSQSHCHMRGIRNTPRIMTIQIDSSITVIKVPITT